MNKQKVLSIIMGCLLLLYVIVASFYYRIYSDITTHFGNYEMWYVNQIEEKVISAIESDNQIDELQEIIERYAMELIIKKDNRVIFETISLSEGSEQSGIIHNKATLSEVNGDLEISGEVYNIYYAIYHLPANVYFDDFLVQGNRYLVMLVIVFLAIIILIQYFLYKPLLQAKETVSNLEKYDFDNISIGTDSVNESLSRFSSKLEKDMKIITRRHSQFELELEQQRLALENMMIFSRAMVHDLKGPLHKVMIYNELNHQSQKTLDEITNFNVEEVSSIMHKVNQILKIISEKSKSMDQENGKIEIDCIVSETLKVFDIFIAQKRLSLNVEVPQDMVVKSNLATIRLLLHNIVSNMIQYALEKTEIELLIYYSSNRMTIISRNKSSRKNIERMRNSEQLFNQFDNGKDNAFGSGNGLHLIKDLALMLDGEYNFEIVDDVVEVKTEIVVK